MNIYDDYAKKDIDIKNLRVRIKKLEEENKTLKDKIEFLTNCLDDRDKSIELMKEENKHLKEVYEACNLDSINKAFKISNLEMENKKLKDENKRLNDLIEAN